jgi:hypothetical protein
MVAFAVISTAFLSYLGRGLARLLMPREWRSTEGLLAVLLGYVLLLLVGYYAVRTVFNLTGALFLALGLATVLNGLALRRWFHERPAGQGAPSQPARPSAAGLRQVCRALRNHLREHGWAWLIALAAFFLAVLPLLSYGYQTIIGENWDPENYLPITEYLVRVPVNRMAEMPPNPIRDLNADPARIGMTLGFCTLQGVLQQFLGWDALRSFAPTIALLYGLTALALYVLFRQGFGMSRRAGTLATLFGGLYALALWIAFFNFGMQMAALPLVPLALTLWLSVLRQPSWRTVLLAAASVAALPVAYYPALTVFVPVALGLGLYELVRARGRRWTVLLAGLGAALLSAGLAVGTILDYFAGFAFRYSQQLTTLGLFHFPPLAQVLGLFPFSRTAPALPTAWGEIVPGIAFLAMLLAWIIMGPRGQRWLWPAALLPTLLYLAWLRGWLWPLAAGLPLPPGVLDRLQSYPYAYLKGAVFVVPLLWGLAVACWERLQEALAGLRWARTWQLAAAGLLLVPLSLVLAADGQVVARYWEQPAHFDQEVLQVGQTVAQIPPGAAVYLTGRPERSRIQLGLFSYFLREHPVQGRLSTAYAGYDYRLPGQLPPFALLDADDDPFPLGFVPDGKVWAGGGMVLYQRPPMFLSFLDLRADAYSQHPSGEIHTKEPLAERMLQSFGVYPTLSAAAPLVLYADAERLSQSDDLAGESGSRSLVLSFATFEPATVTLRWADGTSDTCGLPPGSVSCLSRSHTMPSRVEIIPQAGATVWLCWAVLFRGSPAEPEPGAFPDPSEVVLQPEASADGTTLQVNVQSHNESGRPLRLALEVWENTFEDARHYAWWGPIPLPEEGRVELQADLATREASAWAEGQETDFPPHPGGEGWPEATDGSYFAALWIYYGAHVVEVLPVGRFHVVGGQVQDLQPIALGPHLLWPHSLGMWSGARFGPAIQLAAYERASGPFRPGDRVPVALEWRALDKVPLNYSVSVQIQGLGLLRGQWDGPAGQWYPATAWQPGQSIRDDIPLQVAADAPPGRYRLAVIVYDPSTGQRLPVRSAGGQDLGDSLDLGEVVVR